MGALVEGDFGPTLNCLTSLIARLIMGLKAYLEQIEPHFEPAESTRSGMRFTKP